MKKILLLLMLSTAAFATESVKIKTITGINGSANKVFIKFIGYDGENYAIMANRMILRGVKVAEGTILTLLTDINATIDGRSIEYRKF